MAHGPLEFYSSLIREVEGECAFVRIGDGFLIGGSRTGQVVCWRVSTGEEVWRSDFEGPCSESDIYEGLLFFSESNKVHAIEIETGVVLWSVELEGSSDLVKFANGSIWATSSVYNFEIQDYSEGAVWKIDNEGSITSKWPTVGRAWSLSLSDNSAILGLSRPKCGIATISEENGVVYVPLGNDLPVSIGKGFESGMLVFGHSDGSITEIYEDSISSLNIGRSAVSAIEVGNGWIVGMESGEIVSGGGFDSWSMEQDGPIDVLSFGPSVKNDKCVWSSSWQDQSKISVIDMATGNVNLEVFHMGRIVSSFFSADSICFGDSEGLVLLIEGEVVRRRFSVSGEEFGEDEMRSEMRKKIRRLRG